MKTLFVFPLPSSNNQFITRLIFLFTLLLVVSTSCESDEESSAIFPTSLEPKTAAFNTKKIIPKPSEALTSLVFFLEDRVYPFELHQVKNVSQTTFKKWVKKNNINIQMQQFLKPALTDKNTQYVILNDLRLKSTNKKVTIALVGINEKTKPDMNYSDVVILFNEDDIDSYVDDGGIGTCHYNICFCWNSNSCDCNSATSNEVNGKCPGDECSSDSDCGTSNSGGSKFGIYEALAAF
ncbi:MAG: hypothetical protein ACFB15_23020 [Cyclobacteriaceae bacterium]